MFSLRQRIRVEPGASAVLAFTTAAPKDRVQALALAARFGSLETVDRVFEETTASDAARQAELGLTPDDAALFQRLAAQSSFQAPSLRSRESVARNRLGQPGLWPHAISGDVPITWCESERTATWNWYGRSCRPTRTGAAAALWRTWSFCTTVARATNCAAG